MRCIGRSAAIGFGMQASLQRLAGDNGVCHQRGRPAKHRTERAECRTLPRRKTNGCGSKPIGSHFEVGAPPILEPILVGIGMFTKNKIWLLTHGQIRQVPEKR